MPGQNIAYIRVSTLEQNTARQLDGMEFDRTFTDKASAKDTKRPALRECLDFIRDGDTLHIHSIDRLCRNLRDCQDLLDTLTAKGVTVRFHRENLTFSGQDDSMSKLMLQMMGAFAEFERNLLRERQAEGIAKAKTVGKYKGRKRALSQAQIREIRSRLAEGEKKAALAVEYGVSRQTLYAALKR
ncbi:helix-turn-helix domain-containing protein [Pseudodesulfovibrio cashew]|uniref:Helix-turn-helix domain-containing protein n=1 Tax=Pseudodesulfovibrio cashew TaxID=2678688 RepID=A0A6I6JV11_9BACT|nr:recombinase family protein [Pseudodesulfovibrio cashew]QGY41564.1 helix-turn-helix domain-containing protein [Pseudodesulfovibrio cashew]